MTVSFKNLQSEFNPPRIPEKNGQNTSPMFLKNINTTAKNSESIFSSLGKIKVMSALTFSNSVLSLNVPLGQIAILIKSNLIYR